MALDHYISQVHLRKFYSQELNNQMFAFSKPDLTTYQCNSHSQCRIEDGSTITYLKEPRAIEKFLRTVEPFYNQALTEIENGKALSQTLHSVLGFAAYVTTCSPTAARLGVEVLKSKLDSELRLLEQAGQIPPPPPQIGASSAAEALDKGFLKFDVDANFAKAVGVVAIEQQLDTWKNSTLEFYINDLPNSPFLTSDFPVAIEISEDPRVLNRIVPLSPKIVMKIRPNSAQRFLPPGSSFSGVRKSWIQASKQQVRKMNTAIVQCAEDRVFSSSSLHWIPKLVEKHRHCKIQCISKRIPSGNGFLTFHQQFINTSR